MEATFDAATGIYAGSVLRLSDSSGGEEFLTVDTGGVSWNGNVATITCTSGARSTYPASQNSLVCGVVDLGDLVASASGWAESSAAGTYDEATYSVTVNNKGTVSDSWTLTFTGATTFTVSGANTGSVGSGSTASAFQPINASEGSGNYYFEISAAGWGGTWAVGETITFTTTHACAGIWVKETVPAGCSAKTSNLMTLKLYGEGS